MNELYDPAPWPSMKERRLEAENARLTKALAAAENSLDQYRKVVWHLEEGASTWWLDKEDAKANNLDIEALKKEMGQ